MLKHFWIISTLALLSTGFVYAAPDRLPVSDTTSKKDSANTLAIITLATKDPKEGFRNLISTSTPATGISNTQLHPMAVSFVEDYTEKFGDDMEELKDRGRPYFDVMDAILSKYGLPKELKYLAVVESRLKWNARSRSGAVGPWQFMATTGRNMGLRINKKIDERRDLSKSTHAASRYLLSLFEMYGDWLLVIAAYNGGPGKVNAAIKRSGSRDFWSLQQYLPTESRNHVKKFIATHYIMEGEGGITTLTKAETGALLAAAEAAVIDTGESESETSKTYTISGRYQSSVILRHIAMDLAAFNHANPDFDRTIASSGRYELRLPADKMELFMGKKYDILNESLQAILNQSGSMP